METSSETKNNKKITQAEKNIIITKTHLYLRGIKKNL
jgi:hypothetical protein